MGRVAILAAFVFLMSEYFSISSFLSDDHFGMIIIDECAQVRTYVCTIRHVEIIRTCSEDLYVRMTAT